MSRFIVDIDNFSANIVNEDNCVEGGQCSGYGERWTVMTVANFDRGWNGIIQSRFNDEIAPNIDSHAASKKH